MPRAPPPLSGQTTAHNTPQTSHLWPSPSCGSSGGRCRTRTSPPTSWKEVASTSRLSDCSRSARTTMTPPKPRRSFFSSGVRLLSRPPTKAPPTASWSRPLSDGPEDSASGDATPDAVQLQLRKEGKVLHKTTFRGWQPRALSLVSGSVLRLCHTKSGVFKQQPTCKEQPLRRSSEVVALSEQDGGKADDGRFMFRVVTKPRRGKMHTKWTLDAESQSELDAWVSLVQEAIALIDPVDQNAKNDDFQGGGVEAASLHELDREVLVPPLPSWEASA
ncbi:hypothetical protein Esi_0006_0031 [Ectocarpus siliculosus]|uniref:PH domain-containing protein n=1 Tax=Ectocarpus siliculosus TaxID=2880 RepID=D8LQD1_ECTSI|nr:hypothetical protein Esi_0006_0031 [Ectocarpus siliculosus]|eukprot:CBN78695.1 hypothetical protein Esi_0006_0031 [Ectocarpus siliculosus]